ncbi:type I polyketide synthase [Paragemmobacter ruber]|uniref:SDR family NAD(P)-dependent oxidoreductase n=1 Tax=Paragemmobacter ruber TaxID=1985673 RepID=A0ABW9Y3A5_9RHOB|nr:type I polyketide synthase [Rhodobacter ruber]NBE06424.1 SDR family NAD(P)-dependent oxidoreductase [Rhodobacter ruber]
MPLVRRIFITGRSCRLPGAANVAQFSELLFARGDAVTEVPRDRWVHEYFLHPVPGTKGKTYTFAAGIVPDLWCFDSAAFGISPREAGQMDPQQRLLLQVAWEALEDAGLPPDGLAGKNVGVFVGCSAMAHAARLAQDAAVTDSYLMTGNTLALVSNRISHALDLRGPSITVDTACSSSIVALRLAEEALLRGEVDTAIVAGVNAILDPIHYVGFSAARMLSPVGRCQPFSARADGYVRAEGAVAFVLERKTAAALGPRRAYAALVGVETNTDGRTLNVALPSADGQAALLRRVYDRCGIDPAALAFVEAHGTGTLAGDPVEASALGRVLGQARTAPLPIGSVKSNIGHLEPASGVAGLLKALVAMERRQFPATLHASELNPGIPFADLNLAVAQDHVTLAEGPLFAGVSSFGFGGANAHAILESVQPSVRPPLTAGGTDAPILFLSATGEEALRRSMRNWQPLVAAEAGRAGLRELCAEAAAYRGRLPQRAALICDDPEAAAAALVDGASGNGDPRLVTASSALRDAPAAFVFSGNGSQYSGMGLVAMARDPDYARGLRRIDRAFRAVAGWSIIARMRAGDLDEQLRDAEVAQPLLFADQMALVWALGARGLRPAAVMGHSGGEVAAACASGALTLDQALRVIHRRSTALQKLRGRGTMAAVQAPAPDVAEAIARFGGGLEIAAENSPRSVSVVGEAGELDAFLRHARRSLRWPAVRLAIDYPYHSSAVDSVAVALRAGLADLSPGRAQIPFVSSVTGQRTEGEALDSGYWCENVRRPVAFVTAMATLRDMGLQAFVEIGPSPVLQAYMAGCLPAEGGAILPTLDRSDEGIGINPVDRILARAVVQGLRLDGNRVLPRPRGMRADLPTYPWNPVEVRIDRTPGILNRLGDSAVQHPLLGREEGVDARVWFSDMDAHMRPVVADHRVGGRVVVPGTMLTEMALAAASSVLGTHRLELRDVDLLAPLVLARQSLTEVQVRALPDQSRLTIGGRAKGDEGSYRLHVQARFFRAAEAEATMASAPDPAADPRDLLGERTYVAARRIGLDYGPGFALVERARVIAPGEVEVLLRENALELTPGHATLLDVCGADAVFHGLIAALEGTLAERGGLAFVPVRIARMVLDLPHEKIASGRLRVLRQGSRSVLADFTLFNRQGQRVARMEQVRFQAVRLIREVSLVQHAFRQIALPETAGVLAAPAPQRVAEQPELRPDDDGIFLVEAVAQALAAVTLRDLAPGGFLPAPAASPYLAGLIGIALRSDMVVATDGGWRLTDAARTADPAPLMAWLGEKGPELGPERAVLAHLVAQLPLLARTDADALPLPEGIFGRAAIENLEEGSVYCRRRRLAMVQAVCDVVAALPAGRMVRIAEVTDSTARLLPALLAAIGPDRATFAEIALSGASEGSVLAQDRVRSIAAEPDAMRAAGPFDLILSDGMIGAAARPEALLTLLHSALAPAGRLVALEPGPSDFADLVYGSDPDWFTSFHMPDGPISRRWAREEWADMVARLGLGALQADALPDGCGLANVLILAAPENAARAASDALPDLAALIADSWVQRQDRVVQDGQGRVICTFPPVATGEDAVAMLSRRILMLRDVVAQTTARDGQLICVVSGGTGRSDASHDPAQTALWAFLRSAANENPTLSLLRVDPDPALAAQEVGDRIAARVAAQSAETEVILRADGDAVLRVTQGVTQGSLPPPAPMRAVLVAPAVGGLDDLRWEVVPRQEPGPGEVEVTVTATGLNYRDVMWTMGLLPEEALERGFAGPTIGIECAGVVSRCGPGVEGLAVGDTVLTFGPSSFASHVVVRADIAARLPDGMQAEAAATVPVAFFTAWYALVTLGNLRAGEWVLIHGGAGGVGLAAIQIARHLGLRVIATAGSGVKRSLLRAEGVEHVLDSRSLGFADEVCELTGGRGVDAVLNGLAGAAMERSLACLAPFGRFLELGKQDFYGNTAMGMRPLKENISYHGIDVDQVMAARPDLAARVFAEVMDAFASGALRPLPYRAFGPAEAVSAFRLMQKSGHVGKVLITPPAPEAVQMQDIPTGRAPLCPERTHLVIGGLGGLGLEVAEWLIEGGARRVALMGRRADLSPEAEAAFRRWRNKGAEVWAVACDVADPAALEAALADLRPLAGVIHSAMVLEDMPMAALTDAVLARVLPAKVAGAAHLDRLTRQDGLDYFVLFSSMATLIGNHGQSAYVAANGYLEGIARQRRAAGLPALAVGWGAISDVGYLTRDRDTAALVRRMSGGLDFTGVQVTRALDRLLALGLTVDPVVHISPMGWNAVSVTLRTIAEPAFGLLKALGKRAEGEASDDDLRAALVAMTQDRAEARLTAWLVGRIAHILQVPEKAVVPGRPVADLGIDSLMGVELGLTLQESLGDDVPVSLVSDALSIEEIAARIVRHLHGGAGAAPAEATEEVRLAVQHLSVAQDHVAAPAEAAE